MREQTVATSDVAKECEADIKKFCGVVRGAAEMADCMKPRLGEVSKRCRARWRKSPSRLRSCAEVRILSAGRPHPILPQTAKTASPKTWSENAIQNARRFARRSVRRGLDKRSRSNTI